MTRPYKTISRDNLDSLLSKYPLTEDMKRDIQAVSAVLPFRVNNYVVEDLIDWSRVPDDPMFQLCFPQAGMLSPEDLERVRDALHDKERLAEVVRQVRAGLNPHPAGQMEFNVPQMGGERIEGMQHKYRETVLFFPSQGQTCHAYCNYCFRWAQFIGEADLRFANNEVGSLVSYLQARPEITDVLFTGGDPLIMNTNLLAGYIEPLLEVETLRTIRIGTKVLSWWPYRFTTDKHAATTLSLFEKVVAKGKHLSLMAHYSHVREMEHPEAEKALQLVRNAGALVRSQAPMAAHVNDNPRAWADLWRTQVAQGVVPYYMFLPRDTGARAYYQVPLSRALKIFNEAQSTLSGIGRTARGPVMSCKPGKVQVIGETQRGDQRLFVLKVLQARDSARAGDIFFAKYNETVSWVDELEPLPGESFPFEF